MSRERGHAYRQVLRAMNGTFELTILEATGSFRSFEGGHNHMVDRLHRLANGTFDEYCFCFITRA